METPIDLVKVRYCTVPHLTDEKMLNYMWEPLPMYRVTLTLLDYSKVTYSGTYENLRSLWASCQRNQTVFEGTKVSTTSYETEGRNGTYVVYSH